MVLRLTWSMRFERPRQPHRVFDINTTLHVELIRLLIASEYPEHLRYTSVVVPHTQSMSGKSGWSDYVRYKVCWKCILANERGRQGKRERVRNQIRDIAGILCAMFSSLVVMRN